MGEPAPTLIPAAGPEKRPSELVQLAQAIAAAGRGGGFGQALAVVAIVIAIGWGVVHEFQSAVERRIAAVEERQNDHAKALKLTLDLQAERSDWQDERLELLVERVAPDVQLAARPSTRASVREINNLLEGSP